MEARIDVKPLPYKTRQRTFSLLFLIFFISLPFLYLYATGYRFDLQKPTNLIGTGGIYLAVDITGAEIFIDDELVRQTRAFRKAFYAQRLDMGTHRVHVQREGYHTWVKELPVSKHLVTEAAAFNLPLLPQVRVISEWQTQNGSMVVRQLLPYASSTNALFATTTTATSSFLHNQEYQALIAHFASSTEIVEETAAEQIRDILRGSTTTPEEPPVATSTLTAGGVRLSMSGEDVFASWVGSFEQMPYYYCAPEFPPYSTATTSEDAITKKDIALEDAAAVILEDEGVVVHPVQTIPEDTVCDPTIRIDRKEQTVSDFDFLPGSTDFVIMVLEDGVYVVEVDDRSWQNIQPLMIGKNLRLHIENGNVFVYDGALIYHILLAQSE